MWLLLGREDLAEDPRYLGKDPDGDFYFSNVIPAIEEWSQHLPKWEVAEKLTEIGFSMGIAQTISELDQCPHLEARQMFVETDDTLGGRFRSLKTPIHLTDCEEFTADTPPLLGENNVEILCGIGGLSPEQLAQQMRVTADPIDNVNSVLTGLMGKGRINALRAVTATTTPAIRIAGISFTASGGDGFIVNGSTVDVTVSLVNYLAAATNLAVTLSQA